MWLWYKQPCLKNHLCVENNEENETKRYLKFKEKKIKTISSDAVKLWIVKINAVAR